MVTHDPNAASYADRVIFLADGRVVDELANPTAKPYWTASSGSAMNPAGDRVPTASTRKSLRAHAAATLSVVAVTVGVMSVSGGVSSEGSRSKMLRPDVRIGRQDRRPSVRRAEAAVGEFGHERDHPSPDPSHDRIQPWTRARCKRRRGGEWRRLRAPTAAGASAGRAVSAWTGLRRPAVWRPGPRHNEMVINRAGPQGGGVEVGDKWASHHSATKRGQSSASLDTGGPTPRDGDHDHVQPASAQEVLRLTREIPIVDARPSRA